MKIELTLAAPAPKSVPAVVSGDRRRIWQIDPGMHCAVLGTCLALNDLHVIARRARYRIVPTMTAYELHSWFVDMMAYANDVSKLVDKELEKRHRVAVHAVRRARTGDELEARFKETAADGFIAGAFWGAMSHPLCTSTLAWRFFGEIHMLSHLVGASRRSDLARVHELETSCAALDAKLAHLKHDHRELAREKKKADEHVATLDLSVDRLERRHSIACERIRSLEAATHATELESRLDEMRRRLEDAERRAHAAAADFDEARAAAKRADARARELEAENEALEIELATTMRCPLAGDVDAANDTGALVGKRILCLGGRTNLVPHYRMIVERRGGEFLHHDGGIEDSLESVTRALTSVDAVVCPLDCVSHAATLKVRRACKNLLKRFVPLRSSGLSSFARGIRAIARVEDE